MCSYLLFPPADCHPSSCILLFSLLSLLSSHFSSPLYPLFSPLTPLLSLLSSPLYFLSAQSRLQLVLVNFLSNAVRFSISGSMVTINVSSTARSPPTHDLTTRATPVKGCHTIIRRPRFSLHRKGSRVQQSPHRENRLSTKDSQTRYVTVIVNDLGVGIPEDDHGNIHPSLSFPFPSPPHFDLLLPLLFSFRSPSLISFNYIVSFSCL